MHPARLALLSLCLLAACASPITLDEDLNLVQEPVPAVAEAKSERNEPSSLYARDGTVVSQSSRGPVAMRAPVSEGAPLHDIQRTGEGRMYILELYQNVIEERDTLTLEAASLQAELDRTRTALMEADARIGVLEGQVAAFEAQKLALEEENMQLAGRLTTAQIRRLQAEKILLEIRLEESAALDAEIATQQALAAEGDQ